MSAPITPVRITHDLLVQLGACREHRDIFTRAFPDGLLLTPEPDEDTVTHIVTGGLDVGWLCRKVLSSSAEAEYQRAIAPAWAEYQRAIAPAEAEYQRAIAPAWAEYQRAIAPAWAEYQRAIARAAWRALADRGNWS